MSKYTFEIKPSMSVEGYFVHQCERNLFYNGVTGKQRKDFGLNDPTGSGSSIAAHAGEEWEENVIEKFIDSKCIHLKKEVKNGKATYHKYSPEETIEELLKMEGSVRKNRTREYLYQGCLVATDECKKSLFRFNEDLYTGKDDKLEVNFTRTYPDLIRADWSNDDDCVVFSVVDIKLAHRMKLPHKVQVTLYVRLLKGLIEEYNKDKADDEKLNAKVNESEGYLWNGEQENERAFLLKETDDLLDDYFSTVVPALVDKIYDGVTNGHEKDIKDQLERCVGQKCEWCENGMQCMDELKRSGNISLIPYLTGYAQEYARKTGAPETVKQLQTFVADPDNKQLLTCNRTWDYVLSDDTTIEVQADAAPYDWDDIKNNAYKWKNKRSLTMPRWQDITILLTAQKYAGTGKVYALALYMCEYIKPEEEGPDVKGKWSVDSEVFIAKDDSEEAYFENISGFVKKLYSILCRCHDENTDEGQKKSLQGYVMDAYELKNLEEILYDALESGLDMDVKEKTMEILFWIQGERLVSDSSSEPEYESEFPVITINNELRKLVSLPLAIAYRLPEVITAMNVWIDSDKFITGEEYRLFFEYISNVMRSDAIHKVWYENDTDLTDKIRDHIKKRLYAECRILIKMQGEGRKNNSLIRNLSPFKMAGKVDFQTEILGKWYFETRLENLLAYHQKRNARLQGVEAAVAAGDVLRMKIVRADEIQNGRYTNYIVTLEKNDNGEPFKEEWFSAIMVSEDETDELYGFDDYKNCDTYPGKFNYKKVGVLNFLEYSKIGSVMSIKGNVKGWFEVGKSVYVAQRFTDMNSGKVIKELGRLDNGENSLLLTPDKLDTPIATDYASIEGKLLGYSHPDDLSFTRSQEKAFAHLYGNRLTVLQGPPGTGKTDFIARAVITLCRYYHYEEHRQMRILISANSHPAIENVLFAIDKKMGEPYDISVYKSDRFDGEKRSVTQKGRVKTVCDDARYGKIFFDVVSENDKERPVVVGATNWSCSKLKDILESRGNDFVFDLIIIDEASQVRVMDAMLTLGMGDTAVTRYLLVGDGDQLPAIIQGQYGKDADNRYNYGSVFDFYREQINGSGLMLGENFRMNEILLRYSAEKIYGDGYHSANPSIATRRLSYIQGAGSAGEIVDHVLDGYTDTDEEYWPLVFCRISGATPFEQNNAEVMLASRISEAIRDNVVYDRGGDAEQMLWKGDDTRDGVLGIVSPHHKHIEKLKDRICSDTGMDRNALFIGTVDKLQGQQREAVIVSYGVTDLESAVTEGEFIFNRNRLNVALTRAKCKSITIFSEVLTQASPGMLDTDDEDLQHGIEYVCGFCPFMQRRESDTEIDHRQFVLNDADCMGVTVDVYRKRISK